jgi:P2 family phage contractile tail tube protein
MALPRKLKNFNVFYNAITHIGQCQEVQLPKLERETDDYRGGGLSGKVAIDMGNKNLEMEHTYGGLMYDVLMQYGITTIDGVLMRFAGAYQKDDTGEVDAVEITVRGRHTELDTGKSEAGGKTEFKVKSALTYYKLVVNGLVLIEIDLVHMIEVVGGIDRLSQQRAAIGAN